MTKPSAPKAAANINANGTPPVLASTDAAAVTTRLLLLPNLTIAAANPAPPIAPISAEVNDNLSDRT